MCGAEIWLGEEEGRRNKHAGNRVHDGGIRVGVQLGANISATATAGAMG
jgi:hypothetical protein